MSDDQSERDERAERQERPDQGEKRKDELAPVPEEERIRRVQELEKDLPPAENDRVAQELEGPED